MYGFTRHRILSAAGGVCLALSGLSVPALAQDAAQEYARLHAEAESIQRHNAYLEKALAAQQAEISSLEQQFATLDATAPVVIEQIQKMFTDLEQFVAADLPFLPEERTKRIDGLREMMQNPEVVPAEKYRRLLEAYRIEMEFGRTMESYSGKLPDKGDTEIHFLRLGRVGLMWVTADGRESGYWDATQKAWVSDPKYNAALTVAVRIAKQELTADLVIVPVSAPVQGR
jgi:hypothetical protein